MNSSETLPDHIQEIYNKLNQDFLLECIEQGNAAEWNKYYDQYINYGMEKCGFDNTVSHSQLFRSYHKYTNKTQKYYLPRPLFRLTKITKKTVSGFHLDGAEFGQLECSGVCFTKCRFIGAFIISAKIEHTTFDNSELNAAEFDISNLSYVNFDFSPLQYVRFSGSTLRNVYFSLCPMRGASFQSVDVERGYFDRSNLSECDFSYARIDSRTTFLNNYVNRNTDFTGVGLSGIVMEENIKSILERNIRRIHWNKWYNKYKFYNLIQKINSCVENPAEYDSRLLTKSYKWRIIKMIENLFVDTPTRLFWAISNYGSSTLGILVSFIILNIIFLLCYGILPFCVDGFNVISGDLGQLVFKTILLPFGIIGCEIDTLSAISLCFIAIHVIASYVILAALVTRISVLFQSRSP